MLELNPKLQGKVLDSLLLHMQAERKAPRASKGGRTARGKAQRPQKPQRPGKEKSAPASGIAPAWEDLAADLRKLGLDKHTADALVSWATSQAEQSRQMPVKIRVLHPMEREFISVQAYDYLLELYRLGLMDAGSLENLLENCAYLTSLPASKEQVQKMALRCFTEALGNAGLGQSH